MSDSGIPAARNWSVSSFATFGTSPRLCTLGISIACLKTARVFACQAGSSFVGTVRGSTAASAEVATKASRTASGKRITDFSPKSLWSDLIGALTGSSRGAVPFGEIFYAAHLFQAAGSTLEFEISGALEIEVSGLGVSG